MVIIKLSDINIHELVKQLQAGAVLAAPTETAYALIADSTDRKAVRKIYQLKGRNYDKPLPLVCSSLFMVKKFFYVPKSLRILAQKYWPGALSIRFKIHPVEYNSAKAEIQQGKDLRLKISSDNTAVVRVSSYKLLTSLSKELGKPLTATSANLAGKGELYSGQAVVSQFRKRKFKPDIIIDGGKIKKTKPSTIVGLVAGELKIYRQGEIKIKNQKLKGKNTNKK